MNTALHVCSRALCIYDNFSDMLLQGIVKPAGLSQRRKTAQHQHIHHQDVDGWIIFTGREIYHVKKLSKKYGQRTQLQ